MGDMIGDGIAWLSAQTKAHLSTTVTYHRGASVVVIAAVIGKSEHSFMDDSGGAISVESRDFLVSAADLLIGGVQVEPAVGDKIKQVIGSTVRVFEVSPPYEGERHFRPSDGFGSKLRIHAKEIKTE